MGFVVRLDILRLCKDNTFGVKNMGLDRVKSGLWWIGMDVYSYFDLCAVWYEFIVFIVRNYI